MPRVIEVIENIELAGDGDKDLYRNINSYYTLDGELLAVNDPYLLQSKDEKIKKLAVAFSAMESKIRELEDKLEKKEAVIRDDANVVSSLKDRISRLEMDLELKRYN